MCLILQVCAGYTCVRCSVTDSCFLSRQSLWKSVRLSSVLLLRQLQWMFVTGLLISSFPFLCPPWSQFFSLSLCLLPVHGGCWLHTPGEELLICNLQPQQQFYNQFQNNFRTRLCCEIIANSPHVRSTCKLFALKDTLQNVNMFCQFNPPQKLDNRP